MKFAILAHFLRREDLRKFFPMGRCFPIWFIEWVFANLPARYSFRVATHFDVFGRAEGWIIGIALSPKQMMCLPKDKVRKKLLAATLFAQDNLEAEVLMLGGLTAPLTSAGTWLTENDDVKLSVTTGNTYTSASTIEATEKAAKLAGLDMKKIKMAVVGAAGVIGEAVSRHFNSKGVDLILVGRTPEKLDSLRKRLTGENFRLTCDLAEIRDADLVITVTSHPEALIDPKMLKRNAIVIDVAEPSDLPADIAKRRPDVIGIDGGRIRWDKIDVGMDLGTPQGVGYACITEGFMQALEGRRENYVGSVDMVHLAETQDWAKRWGFGLADFTCFNKPIPDKRFKSLRKKNGKMVRTLP